MIEERGPEGWFLNGEPATPEELRAMEGKAMQLLAPLPAEFHRQYNYETEEAIFSLSSDFCETESHLGSLASILVGYKSSGTILLELTYGYDNCPVNLYVEDDELGSVANIIQELLDGGTVKQSEDQQILRHIQDLVFCMQLEIEYRPVEQLKASESDTKVKYVGDVIRQQVEKNTRCMVRTKNCHLALEDGNIVAVLWNKVVGELPEDDGIVPVLQIELEDRQAQAKYLYSRDSAGDVALESTNGMAWGGFEAGDMSDDDIEVAEFIEALGSDVPGKHDVRLITASLDEALKLDAEEPVSN